MSKPVLEEVKPFLQALGQQIGQRLFADHQQRQQSIHVQRVRLSAEAVARLASRKTLRTGVVPPPAPVSL